MAPLHFWLMSSYLVCSWHKAESLISLFLSELEQAWWPTYPPLATASSLTSKVFHGFQTLESRWKEIVGSHKLRLCNSLGSVFTKRKCYRKERKVDPAAVGETGAAPSCYPQDCSLLCAQESLPWYWGLSGPGGWRKVSCMLGKLLHFQRVQLTKQKNRHTLGYYLLCEQVWYSQPEMSYLHRRLKHKTGSNSNGILCFKTDFIGYSFGVLGHLILLFKTF